MEALLCREMSVPALALSLVKQHVFGVPFRTYTQAVANWLHWQ